ncbi:MAG TPA: hypothetical protein VMQ76_09590, partial [Terracidiphilus sp.]|nr:hypothetical protein [Terracidiphilus sp.]
MSSLIETYAKACEYPGTLNEEAVNAALVRYVKALGIKRKVRRLGPDWQIETEKPLSKWALKIAEKMPARAALNARDALNALNALAARAARAALNASDARDARDALDARDARAALDARDARAARDARDARAALDASAALDARDARAALAARDALAARAARDALDALDARAARDASAALQRFARWCVHRSGWWWSFDLSWLSVTHIGSQQLGAKIQWAEPIFDAFVAGAWFLFFTEDTLYWVSKPVVNVEIVGGNRRLHCETGPAVESDAEGLYFWHGVIVPAFVVTRPDWITMSHIDSEENAEVRRVMMERYGMARYLFDSHAVELHKDDYGTLYRKEIPGDEPLVMVKVVNSTIEPDGSFKEYTLRVPPNITTAR